MTELNRNKLDIIYNHLNGLIEYLQDDDTRLANNDILQATKEEIIQALDEDCTWLSGLIYED